MSVAQARALTAHGARDDMAVHLDWIETYLMQGHPDLGRPGAVCPFTRQAARLDTVRVAISRIDPEDDSAALALVRRSFAELDAIACKPGMEHFRTVIIGFPRCGTAEGVAMLKAVQRAHRFHSLRRGRMIGLMHAQSEDEGLWNKAFRPLRAPMPVLAVRHMVEQDAPFAALHPALMLAYLGRYPLKGTRRLIGHWRGR
ncbi:DUF6875 domain-containing protein [Ensifer soli]|uniref:DUF6875 domain-containing protein n=1 Tax=Ciceribacter sp. sgz301302 TaxID=3342379 RepID=UPI0035B96C2F